MTSPPGWNAAPAVANIRRGAWTGRAWRFHQRSYSATDSAGSALVSGRYHRAVDQFPRSEVWPALYLALSSAVALGEVLRQFSPQRLLQLNDYRLSELHLELGEVLDCHNAAALGLTLEDLIRDLEFERTQQFGAAAIAIGAEAVLVPSATRLGDNLVVFPTQIRSTSRLAVVGSQDPRLYVPR